ncbi:MAG: aminoacyl-tRNA hydrolase [Spirochaetales bacterium]
MDSIALVAFLGNHGKKYEKNRHNVAWLCADSLPFLQNTSWQKKFRGQCTGFSVNDYTGYALKPETFMNASGESIAQCAAFYKIPPQQILVVHDELELPAGTLSLKWAGGLGGHNGLRSTKECLGTADFWRLRLGIGRPNHDNISSWVLSDFTADESILMSQVFSVTEKLFDCIFTNDIHKLLPQWKKVVI